MRLALLNLRYSPNLGDVLLCECLEYGLRLADPGVDIVALDITGRRDFSEGSARRLVALAVMQRLPQAIRHRIARVLLGRSLKRTMPYWNGELAIADAAVLGGGNLLADMDLNFPLKVAAIFEAVAAAGLPTAVHAVGVSDNWSREGEALFRGALMAVKLRHAAVRDERSREIWMRHLDPVGIAPPRVVRDPGLLAAECYPALERPGSPGPRIGICVTHPVALRYHADEEMPGAAEMTEWFAGLVRAFAKRGYATFLFTTGSPEDGAYLDEVMPTILAGADLAGVVTRVPRFPLASDMAGFISTLDLVVGHRLHACVAAYSFGIPHLGFTWDSKMRSFFEAVDQARFVCSAVFTPVADVVSLAEEARRIGISAEHRRAVIADTHTDIRLLLHNLAGGPT